MTNHIEELMKAAGVDRLPRPCNECEHYMDCGSGCQTPYPSFTPAKQLELIKLILKGGNLIELEYARVRDHYCFRWYNATVTYDDCITFKNKYYELALAELVYTFINENKLNKSEVKRILEND